MDQPVHPSSEDVNHRLISVSMPRTEPGQSVVPMTSYLSHFPSSGGDVMNFCPTPYDSGSKTGVCIGTITEQRFSPEPCHAIKRVAFQSPSVCNEDHDQYLNNEDVSPSPRAPSLRSATSIVPRLQSAPADSSAKNPSGRDTARVSLDFSTTTTPSKSMLHEHNQYHRICYPHKLQEAINVVNALKGKVLKKMGNSQQPITTTKKGSANGMFFERNWHKRLNYEKRSNNCGAHLSYLLTKRHIENISEILRALTDDAHTDPLMRELYTTYHEDSDVVDAPLGHPEPVCDGIRSGSSTAVPAMMAASSNKTLADSSEHPSKTVHKNTAIGEISAVALSRSCQRQKHPWLLERRLCELVESRLQQSESQQLSEALLVIDYLLTYLYFHDNEKEKWMPAVDTKKECQFAAKGVQTDHVALRDAVEVNKLRVEFHQLKQQHDELKIAMQQIKDQNKHLQQQLDESRVQRSQERQVEEKKKLEVLTSTQQHIRAEEERHRNEILQLQNKHETMLLKESTLQHELSTTTCLYAHREQMVEILLSEQYHRIEISSQEMEARTDCVFALVSAERCRAKKSYDACLHDIQLILCLIESEYESRFCVIKDEFSARDESLRCFLEKSFICCHPQASDENSLVECFRSLKNEFSINLQKKHFSTPFAQKKFVFPVHSKVRALTEENQACADRTTISALPSAESRMGKYVCATHQQGIITALERFKVDDFEVNEEHSSTERDAYIIIAMRGAFDTKKNIFQQQEQLLHSQYHSLLCSQIGDQLLALKEQESRERNLIQDIAVGGQKLYLVKWKATALYYMSSACVKLQ